MATKFYFIQDLPNYIPPTWNGSWDQNGTAPGLDGDPGVHQSLDPDKYGTGQGTMLSSGVISSTPFRRGIVQLVSRPLLPQTISGTIDLVYAVRQTNASYELFTRIHIYVMNCTSNTVHGTLLNQYEELAGTEWVTATGFASLPSRSLLSAQTLTSVTIPSDANSYRIVAELGYISNAASSTNVQGVVYLGARNNHNGALRPDMTTPLADGRGYAPYIQFSGTITLTDHPISNIGPETATVITALPYTTTFDPLKAGGTFGTDYENPGGYWYKLIAPADAILSILCCNASPLDSNYHLYHEITPGAGPPLQEDVAGTEVNGNQKHIQYWPVKEGVAYYFRVYMNTYSPGNTIAFMLGSGVQGTVQAGDLLIPTDDASTNAYFPEMSGGYQSTYYNGLDGSVRSVTGELPSSELGVSLSNGKFGMAGKDFPIWQRKIWIFAPAPSLALLDTAELPGSGATAIVALGTDFTYFYAALAPTKYSTSPSTIYKVDESGGIITTYGPLPVYPVGLIAGGSNASMGLSRDGTILYYGLSEAGGTLKRHNLTTNTAMSDFAAPSGPAYWPGDVIVLSDNTIVVAWSYEPDPVSQKITHHSTDGTVLRTIDFGTTYGRIHHITHGSDSGSTIWVWAQDKRDENFPDGFSYFLYINLETGLTENSFQHHHAGEDGLGPAADDCNPEGWVAANSCPLVRITPGPDPEPEVPGIVVIVEGKRNDIDQAIPTPTFRTGLLP